MPDLGSLGQLVESLGSSDAQKPMGLWVRKLLFLVQFFQLYTDVKVDLIGNSRFVFVTCRGRNIEQLVGTGQV